MRLKKFYLPIGALLIAICAIALFALRSERMKEPIVIYKPTITETPAQVPTGEVTDTSTGGHVHTDGTWPTESHSQVSATIPEADIDDDAAFEAEMAAYDAEYEAREKRMKIRAAYLAKLEAQDKERKRLEKEAKTLAEEVDKFGDNFMVDAVDLLPVFSMSYDDFHNTYQTVAERKEVARKFAKIELHRISYRDLIENTSPKLRQMIYARMTENGYIETYQRVFLPEEVIKDSTLKAIIAEHAEHPHIQKGR